MFTTVSLVHIHHLTLLQFFSCDKNFYSVLSQQLSNIQYSVVNYSHHAVYSLPRTYLSYNWNFIPFDHLYPFPPLPHTPLLATTNLFSVVIYLFIYIEV